MIRNPAPVATHSRVGPRVVGVGLAIVAVAYIGYDTDRPHPQAAAPYRPPSAVPSSPGTKPKPAKTTPRRGVPKTKPRRAADDVRVVAVAVSKTHSGGGTTSRRPSTVTPSGPKPRPPATPQPPTRAVARCDVGLTVLVLNACLRLGGPTP
jgi:hypothetical protein